MLSVLRRVKEKYEKKGNAIAAASYLYALISCHCSQLLPCNPYFLDAHTFCRRQFFSANICWLADWLSLNRNANSLWSQLPPPRTFPGMSLSTFATHSLCYCCAATYCHCYCYCYVVHGAFCAVLIMWQVAVASKIGVAATTPHTLAHMITKTMEMLKAAPLHVYLSVGRSVCLLARMCHGFCFIAPGAWRLLQRTSERANVCTCMLFLDVQKSANFQQQHTFESSQQLST